jgi:membrane protease YdiL (CAAX protease family)
VALYNTAGLTSLALYLERGFAMGTAAPLQPAAPQRGIKALLARHPLVSFFGMAYAFSWIVWVPWVLGEDGANVLPPALSVPSTSAAARLLLAGGVFAGPTLSAFIMTATTEGREGVRRLLGRLVLWRVGIRWYLFSLLGVPLIMVVGAMIYFGELPNLGALGGPSYLLSYLGLFVFVMVLGGPLFEEIGWRGFALPRMERLQGPILASVILGVMWALWHLPQFLVPTWAATSGGGGILGITFFTLTVIPFMIVITWVFNNTRASVLVAILVHTSIDAFTIPLGAMFSALAAVPIALPFIFIIGFGVVGVVLIVLTRGHLSYGRLVEAQSAPRAR